MNHIGVHIDSNNYNTVFDAVKKAHKMGANAIQIYAGSKILTTLREKYIFSNEESKSIKKFLKENKMRLYIHSILRLNFCKDPIYPRNKWMVENVLHDMKQCKRIGGTGVVIHTGSYKTKTINVDYETCIKNFKMAIKVLLKNSNVVKLIIETPVKRKYSVGTNSRDLNIIYKTFKKEIETEKRLKFCIDTQHIFASGYDLKDYFDEFNNVIGFKNLALIHLNDSFKDFGSLLNKHETVGKGYIFKKKDGIKLLKYILDIAENNKIDTIMETNFNNYLNDIKFLKKVFLSKTELKGGVSINTKKKTNIKPLILKIFNALLINYQSKKNNSIIKYKIDSYKKAIVTIRNFKKPIYSCDDIKDLEYIGKGMCEKIDEISKTGTLKAYDAIKNDKSINAYKVLSEIWGFGDKIINTLISKKIYTISDLKKSIKSGNIKLSQQQLVGLKFYKQLKRKIPRKKITDLTTLLKKMLSDDDDYNWNKTNGNIELHNAGSYRMGAKMCGDIDFILTCETKRVLKDIPSFFKNILVKNNMLEDILLEGDKKSIYIIKPDFYKIDVAYILKEQLPWYLLYFGHSREFSKKIRGIASKKGFKLNEKGLFDKKTGKKIDFNPKHEKDIFDFFELDYNIYF